MPTITNRRSCVSSSGFSVPCSLEFLHLDSQVFLACQSGKLYSLYFSRVHLPSLAISCLCLYGLEFSLSWKSCFSRTPCVFISFTYWNWCQTCVAWSTAAIKCKLPNKPVLLNVSLHCNSVIKNAQCLEKLESLNSSACYNSCDLTLQGQKATALEFRAEQCRCLPDTKYVGDRMLPLPVCSCFHRYGKGFFIRLFSHGAHRATRNEVSWPNKQVRTCVFFVVVVVLFHFSGNSELLGCPGILLPWSWGGRAAPSCPTLLSSPCSHWFLLSFCIKMKFPVPASCFFPLAHCYPVFTSYIHFPLVLMLPKKLFCSGNVLVVTSTPLKISSVVFLVPDFEIPLEAGICYCSAGIPCMVLVSTAPYTI